MSAFTVAICTYQRGDVLAKTLDSLAGIDRPDVPWDVLVVDNAADPRVKQMVNALADRLPVRYVAEPSVGIARARTSVSGRGSTSWPRTSGSVAAATRSIACEGSASVAG